MDELVSKVDEALKRLGKIEEMLASGAGAGAAPAPEELSASMEEWDVLHAEFFEPLVGFAKHMGGDAWVGFQLFMKVRDECRAFVMMAGKSKKPKPADLPKLLKPLADALGAVQALRDKNRGSKEFNQLSVLYEVVPAYGWVSVSPAPAPYVMEMMNAGDFYMNKILREFKGKDENHCNWVKGLKAYLKELSVHVKKFHTTGVAWNPKGGDASVPAASGAPAAPAAPPAPAGPPAPPPPAASSAKPVPNMNALFGDIAKGEGVTKGLKKVTKDMKTKNRPAEERTSVVPAKKASSPAPAPAKKFGAAAATKSPNFFLDGKQWKVEFQKGNKNIIIEDTNLKQTVSLWQCEDSVVQIKGKINSLAISGCKKCGVVFENVVASVEVTNSRSCQVQSLGKCPMISIEKTSGCQVHLSEDAVDCEVVTSSSSEVNVNFPYGDDQLEFAVPEQFKTVIVDGKLKTEVLSHV